MRERIWIKMSKLTAYSSLVAINLLYACTSICTRAAAACDFLSWQYCLWLAGAIGVMGAYAICWQQVLKRIDLSTAYMFKGTSLIFVMLLAFAIFGETITLNNIIGAGVIVLGIVLYAKE